MSHITDNVTFEIVEKIADGGMGAVFKAKQKGVEGFEKTVAIKTLRPELSKDQRFISMFIDEARLVANLVHENIVQIYQLGNCRGSYYFVLEYINGVSLFDFLAFHVRTGRKVPVKLAVYIASRIARGLAYAHSRRDQQGRPMNIVHCDVCPHNILITLEGLPKLTDFGIARATAFFQEKNENTVSGKLPYMSPEQARGEALDFRSDIYSLGIALFHLLAGASPRDLERDLKDVLEQAQAGELAWDRLPLDIDEDLKNILRKMLAKTTGDRYQNSDDLGRELEYYIYKDGYGPTIVTLSNYMREQMPGLFTNDQSFAPISETAKTVILPRPPQT